MKMHELFREFEFNDAPKTIIRIVNNMALPDEYIDFMSLHDGGEGPIGDYGYACLFKLEELEEINRDYDVVNSWPGHIVIGSDMGGMLLAYNIDDKLYCEIDSCNIDEDTYSLHYEKLEDFFDAFDKESEM